MLEKTALRFLYYTSKTIFGLSILLNVICVVSIWGAMNDKQDSNSVYATNKFWADSFGSYWFLRVLSIIIVAYIIMRSVEPYHELEELRIKKLEDEAKENKNEK